MAVPATTQFGVDPGRAIAALGGLVGLADVVGELLIGALAGRDGAAMVGVKAARETSSSSHARLTLRCCALSASMNG
jgi:hypothetical protein